MPFRTQIVLILGLALSACAGVSRTSDKEKAMLHLQLGTSYLVKGAFPQALRELLTAERLDPNEPVILNNLGLAYLVRQKYDEAESRFSRALKIDNQYTDARNNLGRLYVEVGLYDKAIKELEMATSDLTYTQPEKSHANLGQAYFLSGRFAKAKEHLQKSLQARRDNCFTMNLYGRTLFELKTYKDAAEALDQAAKLCEKSKFDEPYFYGGMSYYKLGRMEQARARFNEVIHSYPESRYVKKANEMLEIIR